MKMNIAPLLIRQNPGAHKGSLMQVGSYSNDLLKQIGSSGDFLSVIKKTLNSVQKKNLKGNGKPIPTVQHHQKQAQSYLEALRRGLLSKGKPLNKVFIKKEDLHEVVNLLEQCGYPKQSIRQCINSLRQNRPADQIELSKVFRQLDKLGPNPGKRQTAMIADSSMVPCLESVLKAFGLRSNQIAQTFHTARTKDGRLDLNKLIQKLKVVGKQPDGKQKTIVNINSLSSLSKKIEVLGIQIPDKNLSGGISIADFAAALERKVDQLAGSVPEGGNQKPVLLHLQDFKKIVSSIPLESNPKPQVVKEHTTTPVKIPAGKGKKPGLPSEVKAAIDRILEKVVTIGEKKNPLSPEISVSKPDLASMAAKEINDKTDTGVEPKMVAPLMDKGEKPIINTDSRNIKIVTTQEHTGPAIDRLTGANLQDKMSYKAKPEMKPSDFAPDAVNSGRSEMTLGIKARQPAPATLPNYLVDQMGKQISRSILRGDGIVRFQLKPPEMGSVRLVMDLQDNLLKLGVVTEHSSIKDLLLSSIHELKETLSGQGIKLEKLDVQIQQDFDQSLADSQDGLKGGGRSNRETGGSTHISARDGVEETTLESAGLMQSDYLLDLMA